MAKQHKNIIAIGASLGGIEAVTRILSELPKDFPGIIFVVIHLFSGSRSILDKVFSAKTELQVKFPLDHEKPVDGTVYIAPADKHMILHEDEIRLSRGPRENRSRPSVDTMLRSVAASYDGRTVGVILTGLLDDGTGGMIAIQRCGGTTIAQDPQSAEYPEMPQSVVDAMKVDHILPLEAIAAKLIELVSEEVGAKTEIPKEIKLEVMVSQGLEHKDIEKNIIGEPVPLACPDCGGTLSEIDENGHLRYRCHEGHAYGPKTLMDAQNDKTEYALWAAVRNMEEQANMLHKLAKRSQVSQGLNQHKERADELSDYAQTIKDFLMERAVRNV